MLTIGLIGGVALSVDGAAVRLANRKACAVLAYLAMRDSATERRQFLAGLLWSESEETRARATLRQAVVEINTALASHGAQACFLPSKLDLALQPGLFRTDVAELAAQLGEARIHDLLISQDRISETLLAGYEDLDPAFHGWLLARRQSLHDRLVHLLQDGYRRVELPRAQRRRFAEAARRLDPSDEEACRAFMRGAAEDGDTTAALRAYAELWALLDEDYDTEPSPQTIELVAEIKQGRIMPVAPATSPAGDVVSVRVPQVDIGRLGQPEPAGGQARALAIRVARFGAHGIDPDRMHLVTGFRHEMIACLAKFREWQLMDADLKLADAVTRGDRYEVDATAYQVGSTIQMVLTLRDDSRGVFVWSERFELTLDGWFEAQRHIVRRIAITMQRQISAQRLARLAATAEAPPEVYDRWLRAQAMTSSFDHREWQRAASLLEDTIADLPSYSPIYSSLVQMRNTVHIVFPGVRRDPQSSGKTVAMARRAVELDPDDSRAHLCLGWSYAMATRPAQADLHMALACDLNPNDSWTLMSAALFYAFDGDCARARQLARQAFEATGLPSRSHWAYDVSIAYLAGDDEATLAACDQADDVILTLPAWRAAALHNLGRRAEATQEAARFVELVQSNWFGAVPASQAAIRDWLLHLYPISRPHHWERLRAGVSAALEAGEGKALGQQPPGLA